MSSYTPLKLVLGQKKKKNFRFGCGFSRREVKWFLIRGRDYAEFCYDLFARIESISTTSFGGLFVLMTWSLDGHLKGFKLETSYTDLIK